ncbi:CoA-binding protein [Patescibacteria group bacterium]
MGILINKQTHVVIQGLTGKEGLKSAISLREYHTHVAAGVTPGKGGTEVEGFSIYNTVAEARNKHPEINTSVLYVPAKAVFDAAVEAIESGIKLINIITEQVPLRDVSRLLAIANYRGVRIIGPSSVGIITPEVAKLGSMGGFNPRRAFSKGPVGIISKSGGMSSEIAHMLTQEKIGQTTVIGIGGDRIAGSTFADLLPLFEKDPDTKLVVIYGEIGGTYEEDAAKVLQQKRYTKPLVACISGLFAETLPSGLNLGHAGAIIYGNEGTRKSKVSALKKAGAHIVDTLDRIPSVCKKILS